ncbi:MAG: hypothetical protein M3220_01810 [Chloroflexota bacterium]|nr:hypothetical protein [Chloroflexota bacterium]
MGNESIILWLSPELALGYFVAVVVGMVGLLQVVAVRWGREDLRWLPASLAPWLGLLLSAGAMAWFYFRFYELIFVPGPAGLELILLFGGGTALAVWITRILHLVIRGIKDREQVSSAQAS